MVESSSSPPPPPIQGNNFIFGERNSETEMFSCISNKFPPSDSTNTAENSWVGGELLLMEITFKLAGHYDPSGKGDSPPLPAPGEEIKQIIY